MSSPRRLWNGFVDFSITSPFGHLLAPPKNDHVSSSTTSCILATVLVPVSPVCRLNRGYYYSHGEMLATTGYPSTLLSRISRVCNFKRSCKSGFNVLLTALSCTASVNVLLPSPKSTQYLLFPPPPCAFSVSKKKLPYFAHLFPSFLLFSSFVPHQLTALLN